MSRMTRTSAVLSLAFALLPVLAACGGEEMGEEGMEEAAEPPETRMEPAPAPAMAPFNPLGDSGVTGGVEFARADGTLTVSVTVTGLGGEGDYPSHIHQGTCGDPGGVAVPLESPSAGEQGMGEAVSEVDAGQLEAGTSYLVLVHDLGGAPVACAEVPASVVAGSM